MRRILSSKSVVVLWLAPSSPLLVGTPVTADPAEGERRVNPAIFAAWQAMRQLDCARCHGRDYTGSVGGSTCASTARRGLIASAPSRSSRIKGQRWLRREQLIRSPCRRAAGTSGGW